MTTLILLSLAVLSYGNFRLCVFTYKFYKRIKETKDFDDMSPLWHKVMKISLPVAIFGFGLNTICTGVGFVWIFLKLFIK
jgi:hypothetical protein